MKLFLGGLILWLREVRPVLYFVGALFCLAVMVVAPIVDAKTPKRLDVDHVYELGVFGQHRPRVGLDSPAYNMPERSVTREAASAPEPPEESVKEYDVTFYCPCAECCGKWENGITASGRTAKAGRTIAAPPELPFGTVLRVEGLGERVVEDRGGAIKGNRLDVYVDNHDEALRLGRQVLSVEVVSQP